MLRSQKTFLAFKALNQGEPPTPKIIFDPSGGGGGGARAPGRLFPDLPLILCLSVSYAEVLHQNPFEIHQICNTPIKLSLALGRKSLQTVNKITG